MTHDISEFELEQNRIAGIKAMQQRMARADTILLQARPRPVVKHGPTGMQIVITVVLALGLGLALGVTMERAWTETNAEATK